MMHAGAGVQFHPDVAWFVTLGALDPPDALLLPKTRLDHAHLSFDMIQLSACSTL